MRNGFFPGRPFFCKIGLGCIRRILLRPLLQPVAVNGLHVLHRSVKHFLAESVL